MAGLTPVDAPRADCDIALHSESLAFVLTHEWGRGTLCVNGRFDANYQTIGRFFRQTQFAYANNIGKRFPDTLTVEDVLDPPSFVRQLVEGQLE